MSGDRSRAVLAALALAALVTAALAVPAPASAAPPAPTWSIRSLAAPTNFKPGDEDGRYGYEVLAVNDGGAFTDGSPIVLTDALPAGLAVKDIELRLRSEEEFGGKDFGASLCTTEKPGESEIVRCTIPEEIPKAPDPTLVGPSEVLRVTIQVSTPLAADGTTLTNLAQVQGGGAPVASTTSQNPAGSGPAPAGFSDFRAALLGIDGSSTTQAGFHPYQYTTSFAVNTRAGQAGAILFEPVENLKDISVMLPPGLVGNPTAVTRCTPQQFNTTHTVVTDFGGNFTANDCPDGSVVGMVVVNQIQGKGETLPRPLYNLVPPQGMPAQLGFEVLGGRSTSTRRCAAGGTTGSPPRCATRPRSTG